MRLHVGVLGAEGLFRSGYGQLLDIVNDLAAAMKPGAGETFGGFVLHDGAEWGQNRSRTQILRGDQL